MGSCLLADKSIESPYIDYQRLNIDSLLDLWCSGEVNQIIWKFNKFCENKGTKKLVLKQLPEFFPNLRTYYPENTFHKKIFSLLDHNNDKAINSRQMLWGLTLVLKLQIKQLSEVLFSLYRTGNNHYLTAGEFQQFLAENIRLLKKEYPKSEIYKNVSFVQFVRFMQESFDQAIFRYIFDCTRSFEEIKITEKLKSFQGAINLSKGDIAYVIDAKWFIEWKLYIQFKYSLPDIFFKEGDLNISPKRRSTITTTDSILVNFLEQQKFTQKQRFRMSPKPSKMDNSHLQSQFQGQVKEDLELYQHFVFIPEDLWMMFKQEYGGGPEFKVIYPNINQIFFTQVFVNSKGKFVEGHRDKKPILFNTRINHMLQIRQSQMKLYSVYKRNLGQPVWTKISMQGTVADQCIYNNGFVCKVALEIQQAFTTKYNLSKEPKNKINYGQSILMNQRLHSIVGYVTQIFDQKIKIHFRDKSFQHDMVFDEDDFLKIAKSSKFQYEAGSSYPGLTNLGNTCYMNSVIQCLMATPIFEDFLIKQSYKELLQDIKEPKQYKIIKQLSELAKICSKSHKSIRPSSFINVLKKTLTAFDNYEQHDAEQFFVSLLHELSNELSVGKVSIGKVQSLDLLKSHLKQKYCMIQKFFGGIEKRVIRCEQCKNTIIKNEQFYSLGLPVPQFQYGYYYVIFYPNKQHNQFLPITQYAAKLKKNAKFSQFIDTFSALIGKSPDILNFAEVAKSEFRKHFRDSHKNRTLCQMYIQSGDVIHVYEQKKIPNFNKRKYSMDKKKNFPADLKKGTFIDILYYTQYQVATFIEYDDVRKKVKYQSIDIQHQIDEKFVAPFLSKTYYKPSYNIEVQHRRYNEKREQYQFFLRPFMVSIPEWIKWSDALEIINEEAARFFDESYWQKVTSTGFSTPNCDDQIRKRTGSDSQIIRSRTQTSNANLMNKSQIKKQVKVQQKPSIIFPDMDNNKLPYSIHVLNTSNEMCAICNKRIKPKSQTKQKQKQQKFYFKQCKGCQYDSQTPISLIFDIKRIMFVMDWDQTLAVNPDSNKITHHNSCQKIQKLKMTDRFKIQDCLKLYSSIQENIQVTCQKCKYTTSSLQCLVSKTPNILIFHLKRFKYSNGYFSKIQSPIECPLLVSLQKITTDQSSSKYELYGIVCHMGSGFAGHYYSYIRKGRNKWILCDDQYTKQIDDIFQEISLKNIYLLLFKKMEVDGSLLNLSL